MDINTYYTAAIVVLTIGGIFLALIYCDPCKECPFKKECNEQFRRGEPGTCQRGFMTKSK